MSSSLLQSSLYLRVRNPNVVSLVAARIRRQLTGTFGYVHGDLILPLTRINSRRLSVSLPAPVSLVSLVSGIFLSSLASFGFDQERRPSEVSPVVTVTSQWSAERSAEFCKIDEWGRPYFHINSRGKVVVRPYGTATSPDQEIDIVEVVEAATKLVHSGRHRQLALLIQFLDLIRHHLESLHNSFGSAMKSRSYRSHYQGVFPLKCNHDLLIIDDVLRLGRGFNLRLQVESKQELLLAMQGLIGGSSEAYLICNGYKDKDYINLASVASAMGFKTYLVLEKEEEVDLVLDTWPEFNIRPMIGLQELQGRPDEGPDKRCSKEAKGARYDGLSLRLLRLDFGSQTPSTVTVFDAVVEATETYCELAKLGARVQAIDVGGDFCLNYDGCLFGDRETEMSVVDNLDEYASVVVGAAQTVCDKRAVPHPVICSESGRFMLPPHSVLVFEPISSTATVKSTTSLDPVRPSNIKLSVILQTPGFSAKRPYPVIPLHCLDQQPQAEWVQLDPTSGSSGVQLHEHKQDGGRNYMGMFLVDGAALQRVQNIFGELSSIRVELSDEVRRYKVTHAVQAASCEEIAQERKQDPRLMLEALKQQVSKYDLQHWTVTVLERVFRSSFPGGR
ncbi:hypothetical protein BHM03_00039154 [Ensete ventricosum]|nr:hypothetical protein BHM03_00039154 [Ensete ventricosum]